MRCLPALVYVLASLSIAGLEAAAPLDRVRKDAGLCVVIDDLPDHLEAYRESSLRERLESLQQYQKWEQGPEYLKLQTGIAELESLLGHSVPDALANLAGDQLVLAVYPRAEEEPAGILISSPRDHDLALQTIDLWNHLEHARLTKQPGGYWKRETDKSTLYYLLARDRFALSDREALIRDLAKNPVISRQESIREAPGWARAQQSFDDRSWMRAWFRPEIWSGILELPDEKPGFEMLLGQLKRAESVTLELDTEAGVHASLRLLYKPEREPELLIDYRTQHPATAGILAQPSAQTMVLLSGRGGFAPLARLLARGWPNPRAKETRIFRTVLRGLLQGRDPYEDVLPRLGQDWSLEVSRSEQGSALPVNLLLQMELQRDAQDGARPTLAAALDNLLSTGVHLLRDVDSNSAGEVRTVNLNQEWRLTVYQSLSGWEPSFLVDANRIMISSSENRLRDALADRLPQRNLFQSLSQRSLATSQAGLLVNLEVLRAELASRPEEYLELFRVPRNKRSDSLENVSLTADTLGLFDGAYLLWNCREGEWSLYLGAFERESGVRTSLQPQHRISP